MREIATRGCVRARITRTAGIAVACTALALGVLAPAQADDDVPSAERVASAKSKAASAARDVGAIKAELVAAEQRVESLGYQAAAAAEAYNGARYRLAQAKKVARKSAERSSVAVKAVEAQRTVVSALTVQGLQDNSNLNRMSALFDSAGPTKLLEQTSAYGSTNEALTAELGTYESTKAVARLAAERGGKALKKQRRLASEAKRAKAGVDAAVAASEQAMSTIAAERSTLIRRLAKAQGTSVRVARARQTALEERAEQRAIAAAAQSTADDAPEPVSPRPAAAGDGKGADDGPGDGDTSAGADSSDRAPRHDSEPSKKPKPSKKPSKKPGKKPKPDKPHNPSGSGGADAAIAYAKRQLGEPYVYGAAGPSSWDCSGLTMRAWAAAGRSLPHFSGAQYSAGKKVSMGSIRKGDLLFWSNGGPGSIYHVALYLGGGQMIHAPRPGRGVEIVPVSYWIAPDLAARY